MAKLRNDIDLTEGVIWKQIVRFALPLLIGNIFQILYNTVDTLVVGNFVNKQALGAVGMMGAPINAMVSFFIGIANGATVVISNYFGAKDDDGVSKSVQTTIALSLIASVICTVMGICAVPMLIKMMKTPLDMQAYAREYLHIYFMGISGLMIYNIGAGIMRAVGDSRRPLYFLIVSALLNTVLDLLFVVAFKWEVRGVALATIISQAVSAVLVMLALTKTHTSYRILWRKLRIHMGILKRVIRIGLPAAIQSTITSISNVFVQGYINAFGSGCAAGWTVYGKIDQYALLPINSLAISATTFVGQNIGAKDVKRAKSGIKITLFMAFVCCVVVGIPLLSFSRFLVGLFNRDSEVLYYGATFLRMMSPFYFLCAVNQMLAGSLRGAGFSTGPMVIMLASFVAFRQLYLFVCSTIFNSIYVVALAYPMGWILCSLLMVIYYKKSNWEKKYLDERT
ncbi:MAG: MATE family efflux transporter [Clostridiales bacterium]|nr:MATE family efflux transporter [Clostridiales bacterium]